MVAFAIAPGFTALALAFGAALAWLMRHKLTESRRLGEFASQANTRVSREITEFLQALNLTKAYGAETQHITAFAAAARSAKAPTSPPRACRPTHVSCSTVSSPSPWRASCGSAASWAKLPLADLLVLILVFQRLLPMLQSVQELSQQFVHASPAYRSVAASIEACEAAADPPDAANQQPVTFEREIRLEGVHFGYGNDHPDVLRGIDLSLPAGSLTALSGVSGAGNEHDPRPARRADGAAVGTHPDRRAGPSRRRSPQRGGDRSARWPRRRSSFMHSIRANLAWARPDASDEAMRNALRLAGLADFTAALPQGLDTVVGDRGANLSGGERQRLALARLLLREPRLILLDEPASALDAGNEERILETIAGLKGRATILLVTHRPDAIAAADKYVTLVEGRLV